VTHDQHEALTMSDGIAVMDRGRVLQTGSPEEIYERPANRFVADFIGETNLLRARRVSGSGFQVEGGALIEAAEGGEAAGEVTIGFRPERARIVAPGEGTLPGVIENAVYVGTDTTYHVRLSAGPLVRVRAQNADGARPVARVGETVGVVIAASAVRVLPE
jgi:spermidine/putrescine transport system ATP-binding protein